MKRFSLLLIFSLASSLLAKPAYSQLYEAHGQAIIEDNNIQKARELATQNALKKALLVAGASVSSIQQVVNGLLTENQFSVRASGNVNAVELISEDHQGEILTVTIRADIFPQERQCFSSDYRKPLVVAQSELINRDQAVVGQIYDLGKSFSHQLSTQLRENSQFIDSRVTIYKKTGFSRLIHSNDTDQLKRLPVSIAQSTDSQFVIYAEINDISVAREGEGSMFFWREDLHPRAFSTTVYLFSGTNGDLIFRQQYQNEALWEFDKRESVDVHSQDFWLSDYGLMLSDAINQIAMDLDQLLMCEPTQAKVLKVDNNQVKINLGEDNGVKIGDELSLVHANSFMSKDGILRSGLTISKHSVVITHVERQIATARTINNEAIGNIQEGDLAIRM